MTAWNFQIVHDTFNVGITKNGLEKRIKRNGWVNWMRKCDTKIFGGNNSVAVFDGAVSFEDCDVEPWYKLRDIWEHEPPFT